VDSVGCSSTQTDGDGDGVLNTVDDCPNTGQGETVNSQGCSSSQVDSDGDGVYDNLDDCPNTTEIEGVNSVGCGPDDIVDLDSDGDGIRDSVDSCPNTDSGSVVNSAGCVILDTTSTDSAGGEIDSDFWLGFSCCILIPGIVLGVGWRYYDSESSTFISDNNRRCGICSQTGHDRRSCPQGELEELRKYKKKVETEFLGGEGFGDSQDFNKDFKKGDFNK
jgi:hypothetical protein